MNKLIERLEELIDAEGIDSVIEAMQDICHEKADHLRVNWQDEASAKAWDELSYKLLAAKFQATRVRCNA